MSDWFGEVVTGARAPSYICCPFEPVVGDTILLVGEPPEMAVQTRSQPTGLVRFEWRLRLNVRREAEDPPRAISSAPAV